MLPYKNVYSLQDGKLVKNKENKIEYLDEKGKRRVKTNPTYKDFAKVGKYPLMETGDAGNVVSYKIENGYIVPIHEEKDEL